MVHRSVHSARNHGSQTTFVKVSHQMGDQSYYLELLCAYGKLLVPAAFAVVSTHSSFKVS
jgi:hypothetical protein